MPNSRISDASNLHKVVLVTPIVLRLVGELLLEDALGARDVGPAGGEGVLAVEPDPPPTHPNPVLVLAVTLEELDEVVLVVVVLDVGLEAIV